MPISPDIQRAIEIIDQRIQSLQRIREMLVKEFGIDDAAIHRLERFSEKTPLPPVQVQPGKSRKQTLIEFLKTYGPMTRAAIETKTGMPKGTIAFLLNKKDLFQRLDDGRWTVKP